LSLKNTIATIKHISVAWRKPVHISDKSFPRKIIPLVYFKTLTHKSFVEIADSYAGVPAIKVVRMILAARAGDRISSADLITSYLQADDFDDGESLLLKFWHPLLKKWIYK
jgi:hypothetical protein